MDLLRKLLFPFSLAYAGVVYLRNFLYDRTIFKSKSFNTPVVAVGNLSVGGTGKTPMVETLIRLLQDNYKVAVLSRGYRRKSRGFVLADANSNVEDLGDEPFQIHSKFSGVTVAVDANRRNGIALLEKFVKPDVIFLDDAFQHRKVKPDLLMLLTSYEAPYYSDWYLPTGNLRDSRSQAYRADLIIVTKCPSDIDVHQKRHIVKKINPTEKQQVLFAHFDYTPNLMGIDQSRPISTFSEKEVTLVTGIADPKPIREHLRKVGVDFEHLRYNDHHFFTESDLQTLRKKKCIITTEKDYVRLKGKLQNIFYIGVRHRFSNADQKILEEKLNSLMSRNS